MKNLGGFLLVFLIPLCALFATFNGCGEGYSEGERTGIITKLSYKGLIWKTWEGEMNLGGMVKDGNGSLTVNTWLFTIEGDKLIKKAQDFQRSQKPCTLKYREWLSRPVSRSDSGYMIVEIK